MGITFRELKPNEMDTLFPLVKLLHPNLTKTRFTRCLKGMLPLGYRAVAAYDGKHMIGCSGFSIATRLWCGRLLDISNFVVHPGYRAQGIGARMLQWLEQKAKSEEVERIVLDTYTSNIEAHRFYHRHGFAITGYHLTKLPRKETPFAARTSH
jgi:ribosomal protein S18 acetylase RimI-like enzyme